MLCHAMPCHAMACYGMLCYAMPCYAMLRHAMPWYEVTHYNTVRYNMTPTLQYYIAWSFKDNALTWVCGQMYGSKHDVERRRTHGQFSKVQSGKMGPAPGRFDVSKGILTWTWAMVLGFETLTFKFRELKAWELTVSHALRMEWNWFELEPTWQLSNWLENSLEHLIRMTTQRAHLRVSGFT